MSEIIEGKNYWNRVGFVKIEDEDGNMIQYGGKDSDGLDIKFEIEKLTGDAVIKFNVSILGLNHDTINRLTIWNPAEAFEKQRRIEIYAGYEKDSLSTPIAEGLIMMAYPTNPPEMWINIMCLNLIKYKDPIIGQEEMKYQTREAIFKKSAEILGLRPDWCAKNGDKKIPSFSFDCNKLSLIEKLKHELEILVNIDGGCISAHERNGFTEQPTNATPVDYDNGMMNLGNVTLSGATIRMRLNDTVSLFSWIKLKSKIVPKADDYYYVIKKTHVGHLRGKEWYTDLTVMRRKS